MLTWNSVFWYAEKQSKMGAGFMGLLSLMGVGRDKER
jgi:hypothetical protein